MRGLATALLLGCLTFGYASDWPHFRGPDQDGKAPVKGILSDTFGFEMDWKRELGSGYSCISVAGDTGVTMYSNAEKNLVLAFNIKTGEKIWEFEMGPVYKGHSGSHDGPTGTPTIHDGMVYALDPHGPLFALTLDKGEKVWSHFLSKDVEARLPHYGFNTVPMVMGDALIVMTGKEGGRAFTAFNPKTGAELWHSGDDTTTYQTPFVGEYKGKQRLMGVTDNYLMELDPSNGKVLWQQEHKTLDNESYALPLFMQDDHVMILNRRGVATFKMKWEGDKATMDEVWRNNVFMRTYAIPVYHKGYVFGFKSSFLACIDPSNGEIMWRSRPPGGKALTLVDGHLVLVSDDGDLVAIEATHEGYKEKARIKLFDQDSYTAVTYADGVLFARNRKEMARIKITDKATLAEVKGVERPELKGAFGEFIAKLEKASDKKTMIDAYMKKQKSFPITEKDGVVHYVYRGDEKDIAVARGFEDEVPMYRVAGTDLFFHTETLDADSHWEYNFSVFGDPKNDPLNPHTIQAGNRERNELRMPGWKVPDYLGEPKGERGRLETLDFKSETLGDERKVMVYLPAGYDGSDKRYPLLLFNQGDVAIESAHMDKVMDHLQGKSMAPTIVAFIATKRPESMGPKKDGYAEMLAKELIPHLDATYRTQAKAESRGLIGNGTGAIAAVHCVAKYPATYGKLGTQSFAFFGDVEAAKKVVQEADAKHLQVFVEISTNDYKFPGLDAEASAKELTQMLQEKGATVKNHTNAGAPGWGNWRAQYGRILDWFAPNSNDNNM